MASPRVPSARELLDRVELDLKPAEPEDRDAILDALAALLLADLRRRPL